LFDVLPADLNYNVTGWLVYDKSKALPPPTAVDEFNDFDDFDLVPYDKMPLLQKPDQIFTFNVVMANLGDGRP
jgi:iron transport multicopper oxidase